MRTLILNEEICVMYMVDSSPTKTKSSWKVSFKEVEDAGGRVLACAYEVPGWVGKMAV